MDFKKLSSIGLAAFLAASAPLLASEHDKKGPGAPGTQVVDQRQQQGDHQNGEERDGQNQQGQNRNNQNRVNQNRENQNREDQDRDNQNRNNQNRNNQNRNNQNRNNQNQSQNNQSNNQNQNQQGEWSQRNQPSGTRVMPGQNQAPGMPGRTTSREMSRSQWHGDSASFDRLDTNRDGRLSMQEREMGRNNTTSIPSVRHRGLDRNGDGIVSRSEWQGNTKSFNRLDRNHDGRLTADELNGMKNYRH